MPLRFKKQLKGKRITLKRTMPTVDMATTMFTVIDQNREHLEPWFPWPHFTYKVEDSLKYLFDKEEETQKGTKVEYGIYIDKAYIGNISLFDIDEKSKAAEIGYWIASSFTRKGYTSEAVRLIEKEAFESLHLNRILIKCDERNTASIGVAKKCNYVLEGTHREDSYNKHFNDFRNTHYFSKLYSEYRKSEKSRA